jgi:hypothetical protein
LKINPEFEKMDPDPMNANPHTGNRNGNPGSGEGRRGAIIDRINLKKKTFSPGAACSQTRPNQSVASTSRQIKQNQSFVQIGILQNSVPNPDPDQPNPMFLGLPDLDPLVRGMDPDPSIIVPK